MPTRFRFAQFKQVSPLTAENIWVYIFERHAERIGVRRRKPALQNLEIIFNATFRLANDVGFRAMTLRDLCRETEMSMGGLYGYIENKAQLAEIIEDVVRHASQEILLMYAHVSDPLARLEAVVRASIYLSEILQPWFYFVFLDSRALAPEQRAMAKASELHMQTQIRALIEDIGAPRRGAPALLASHLLALSQDWYVKRWKYRAAKVTVDQFADSVVLLVRQALA
ncbi:MAG: helix-turn-helix domain-containing protein [Pseudomonadota bacterium]